MPGIDECLLEAMLLPGAQGAAVIDWTSGLALGTVGDSPNDDHETTAVETAELARMATEHPAFAPGAGDGLPVEDVIISNRNGYHLLRFIETSFDSSVFLYIWLDRERGNLALARIRMRDLAQRLVLA
ncbi:hypothetical protein [Streptomyces sp. H27-C3]|uniref:hypothetical protein n=1 Tax=Streptomyces sp. H27-C3 TaxID=3046305 RepID=UPI0024B975B4|nr:hypothetical protein [Streptomyces sp. H27-C3]MDJ0460390.1 hypothetical protein [Streptomyces sp. H27-C3]